MDESDIENARLLDELEKSIPAMNVPDGEKLLSEVKKIFDRHGVVFFLRQGTCLGAVRDQALIPWDDDIDVGSIFNMHGFSEDLIDPVVESLRANDFYVEVLHDDLYISVRIMKYRIKIDWQCYRVTKGAIPHYPGSSFPVSLFTNLSEVDFLGDTYLVPSPPEDYLRLKYGPDWHTPKQVGYEKDVLDAMPKGRVPGRARRIQQFIGVRFSPDKTARLRVLNHDGQPVAGAEVRIAGLNRSRTNRHGVAKFYVPRSEAYAVSVTFDAQEEVLYAEALAPGFTYLYQRDRSKTEGRYFVLTAE